MDKQGSKSKVAGKAGKGQAGKGQANELGNELGNEFGKVALDNPRALAEPVADGIGDDVLAEALPEVNQESVQGESISNLAGSSESPCTSSTPFSLAAEAVGTDIPGEDSSSVEGRWYILHTYSGFEQRVEQTLKEMMRTRQDHGMNHEVVVPTEKVIELGKGGQKRTTTRKFYPGYVMVRMTMTDLSWHQVQAIPKVTGFVGGKNRPAPMGPGEAERILSLMETRQEQPRPKFNFERGDEVRVVDGPFGGFNGVVEEVNYDKGKLKVSVSIFGRQTPVELDFIQVSKG